MGKERIGRKRLLVVVLALLTALSAPAFAGVAAGSAPEGLKTDFVVSGDGMIWLEVDGNGVKQVHYRNLTTGEERKLTNTPSAKDAPHLYGNTVVWADKGSHGPDTVYWDIYRHDLVSGLTEKVNKRDGELSNPITDGVGVVWFDRLRYGDMFYRHLATGDVYNLGEGMFPALANGLVVFRNSRDGGLSMMDLRIGRSWPLVRLGGTNAVDWFVFNGSHVLWKQRYGSGERQYLILDVIQPFAEQVELTPMTVWNREYAVMAIGDTQAVFVVDEDGMPAVKGVELSTGRVYEVNVPAGNIVGFSGDRLVLVMEDGSVSFVELPVPQGDPEGESPGDESPGGESPGEESPGDESPGEESPGGESPGEESPGGESPGEESPGGESPGEESPGDESPGVGSPGDGSPGGESPGSGSPGGGSPGGGSPGGGSPGGESPGGGSPGGGLPGGDNPSEGTGINGEDVGDSSETEIRERIGPEGGELSGEDGQARLRIATGTFAAETEVKLEKVQADAYETIDSNGRKLEAHEVWHVSAGTAFDRSAELALGYASRPDWHEVREKLGIYAYDEASGRWTYIGGITGREEGFVHAEIQRPGLYAVMLREVTFPDIESHWARQAVETLAARGIVDGKAGGSFDPNGLLTRAEFAKLLVMALGLEVESSAPSPFADVSDGAWYVSAVKAASEAGLVTGDSGRLRPEEPMTREQMAAVLVRAVGMRGGDVEEGADLSGFRDAASVSGWAREAISRAVGLKLIEGSGDALHPQGTTTRAQAAVVIYRLLDRLNLL